MNDASFARTWTLLVAAALAASLLPRAARAESQEGKDKAAATTQRPAVTAAPARHRFQPDRFAGRAGKHYQLLWGVDSLSVKLMESGELVRFSWRVLDPEKARALGDRKSEPSLIDPRAGVKLVVPAMEKVGQLRQSGAPEAGKAYWVAFSNKGRPVKKGDRVDVVIGQFRAQNLVVD
jgi:hypothetical protein